MIVIVNFHVSLGGALQPHSLTHLFLTFRRVITPFVTHRGPPCMAVLRSNHPSRPTTFWINPKCSNLDFLMDLDHLSYLSCVYCQVSSKVLLFWLLPRNTQSPVTVPAEADQIRWNSKHPHSTIIKAFRDVLLAASINTVLPAKTKIFSSWVLVKRDFRQ